MLRVSSQGWCCKHSNNSKYVWFHVAVSLLILNITGSASKGSLMGPGSDFTNYSPCLLPLFPYMSVLGQYLHLRAQCKQTEDAQTRNGGRSSSSLFPWPVLWAKPSEWDFPGGPVVKNSPPMQGAWIWSLVREGPTWLGVTKPRHHKYWTHTLGPSVHN